MAELNWSDAQWQQVNDTVTEAFGKATVASVLLPCYGPLPASAEYVRKEELKFPEDQTVTVEDDETLKLFNLRVFVKLSNEQVCDQSLSSALLAFRRAANVLALAEDDIVFNGYGEDRDDAHKVLPSLSKKLPNQAIVASFPDRLVGLVHAGDEKTAEQIKSQITVRRGAVKPAQEMKILQKKGLDLVTNVASAVAELEKANHPGPFACILGHDLFVAAHTPTEGLVLPADRIKDILGGPLLRSGQMGSDFGVVVSQAGGDIDLVVATPPKVQFLQIDSDAKYIFRVYEKFILRIKDATAVRGVSA